MEVGWSPPSSSDLTKEGAVGSRATRSGSGTGFFSCRPGGIGTARKAKKPYQNRPHLLIGVVLAQFDEGDTADEARRAYVPGADSCTEARPFRRRQRSVAATILRRVPETRDSLYTYLQGIY